MYIPVKLGDKAKPIAIEKFRGAKNVEFVISIPSRDIAVVAIHYEEGLGYFYCFKGVCCQEGLASMRYIIPAIQYTSQGRAQYGAPYVMKYLTLGSEAYETLKVKDEISEDLTKKDLLVTCSDEQYQRLNFEILGDASWKNEDPTRQMVVDLMKEYRALIAMSVARNMTEEKYLEAMKKEGLPGSTPQPTSTPLPVSSTPSMPLNASPAETSSLPSNETFDFESLLEGEK